MCVVKRDDVVVMVMTPADMKVPVMADAHGAAGIVKAATLGCRSIEHASFIDQEGIEACLAADCWIVPTFLVGAALKD